MDIWRYESRFARAALVALILLIAATISACALKSGSASAGTTTSSTGHATPITTAVHTSTITPTVTPKPSSTTGQIRLLPSAARYSASDVITVTIHNGTDTTAYAMAHFTDCSIILVERQVEGSWHPVNQCADGNPHPVVTQIAPGAETTVQVAATSASSDAQADAMSQWPAGIYRAELTYTSSQSAAFGTGTSVFSSIFIVG